MSEMNQSYTGEWDPGLDPGGAATGGFTHTSVKLSKSNANSFPPPHPPVHRVPSMRPAHASLKVEVCVKGRIRLLAHTGGRVPLRLGTDGRPYETIAFIIRWHVGQIHTS